MGREDGPLFTSLPVPCVRGSWRGAPQSTRHLEQRLSISGFDEAGEDVGGDLTLHGDPFRSCWPSPVSPFPCLRQSFISFFLLLPTESVP